NDRGRDALGAIERQQSRMLGGDGVGLEILLEAFSPDAVKALSPQPRQKFGSLCARHAMRRIKIVGLPKKAAMIGRMPVLRGVNPRPIHFKELVNPRHDGESAGDGQFGWAKLGKAALSVNDKQTG